MKNKTQLKRELSIERSHELLTILQSRFEKNLNRHIDIKWDEVLAKLKKYPEKLWSLHEMEETGGEPDVIGYDDRTGQFLFCDCSPESPQGRRSVCYDFEALDSRKEHKPFHSAQGMASEMGITVINESQYRSLQQLGDFDTKTSSWIATPPDIRKKGGALFGDRRYGAIFIYHNGAESYYAARGFRGILEV